MNECGIVTGVRRDEWNAGILAVEYLWTHRSVGYKLIVRYPHGFPWTRPEVILIPGQATLPRRHCDPITGTLCYLGHAKHAWGPGMYIADLIDEQLPKILVPRAEVEQDAVGEPAENWWSSFSDVGSAAIINSDWKIEAAHGILDLVCARTRTKNDPLRGMVAKVHDEHGTEIARWDGSTLTEFSAGTIIKVPWIRFPKEIFPTDAGFKAKQILNAFGAHAQPRNLGNGLFGQLVAAIFPTELTHGKEGQSWVFLLIKGAPKDFKPGAHAELPLKTLRTLRAGFEDRMTRAPSAKPLHQAKILLAGAGAIGGPIALELARNGIRELGLADFDHVSPGNSVRWPLGGPAWGQRKVDELATFIRDQYPDCAVSVFPLNVGHVDLDTPGSSGFALGEYLRSASAVIDATTVFAPLSILYERCSELSIPLVSVNATPTVEGGSVTRFMPGLACPTCLVFHQQGDAPQIPPPPGEGGNDLAVSLPGCAEATFAGTSFDLQELSLQTVRLVAATLAEPVAQGSVVQTLSFLEAGSHRVPSWRVDDLTRHADCQCS